LPPPVPNQFLMPCCGTSHGPSSSFRFSSRFCALSTLTSTIPKQINTLLYTAKSLSLSLLRPHPPSLSPQSDRQSQQFPPSPRKSKSILWNSSPPSFLRYIEYKLKVSILLYTDKPCLVAEEAAIVLYILAISFLLLYRVQNNQQLYRMWQHVS